MIDSKSKLMVRNRYTRDEENLCSYEFGFDILVYVKKISGSYLAFTFCNRHPTEGFPLSLFSSPFTDLEVFIVITVDSVFKNVIYAELTGTTFSVT